MGQIIIDLPLRVRRHYKIDDAESAKQLLAGLQTKRKNLFKLEELLSRLNLGVENHVAFGNGVEVVE